jgi:hypothetical protein
VLPQPSDEAGVIARRAFEQRSGFEMDHILTSTS